MREDVNKKTKYTVLIMALLRGAVYSFSQTFLNIYLVKETGNNELVLLSLLLGYTVSYVQCHIMMCKLNERNAKPLYILSFIMLFAYTVSLPLTKGLPPVAMTFIVQALAASSKQLYYGTTEMVIMGANDGNTMRKYAASVSIMEAIPAIAVPFITGATIAAFSYNAVFVVLVVSALLLLVLSRGIESFCLEEHRYDFRGFSHLAKEYHIMPLLSAHAIKTISMHNTVTEFFIPYMILLRTGSELSVGSWASLISLSSVASLAIYKRLSRKPHIVFIAVLIFSSAIPMLYNPSVISVAIFYAALKIAGRWIDVEGNSIVYAIPSKHSLQEYKREYNAYFNGFLYVGRAISVLTTLSLYIIVPNATAFAIAVLIFEFLLIPAMVIVKKYQ